LPGEITEDDLKRMLLGKQLFLRGGYMDNDLNFNEMGALIGHSPQGSYTLNEIHIDRVRLTKHKVELEGTRFGLHFLGALAYEDSTAAVEPLRITPKKKVLKITIDREQVLVKKTKKEPVSKGKAQNAKPAPPAKTASASPIPTQPPSGTATANTPQPPPAASEPSDADQLKAGIAAAPASERPADSASVTTTFSPAHAAGLLRNAIDRIFAVGIDDRLIAAMPECWKLYYQAVAEKADYRPKDPAVLRQSDVEKKARLLSVFQPDSNEYAQADAVSGLALYHTVIGPDGKPQEIAVARPIGFGLDENAVESIRKASFEPAVKEGKPVPVLLDLVVEFHIYSKRTAAVSKPDDATKPPEPQLPGPYSIQHP
jgi:outer membrane biosynthesis protein TonB